MTGAMRIAPVLFWMRQLIHAIDNRHVSLYSNEVIKSFRHKGLEQYFLTGSKSGIQPAHAQKLQVMLTAMESAAQAADLNAPGWRLHELKGARKGFFSLSVSGNWRVIFCFDNQDIELVDYLDYH